MVCGRAASSWPSSVFQVHASVSFLGITRKNDVFVFPSLPPFRCFCVHVLIVQNSPPCCSYPLTLYIPSVITIWWWWIRWWYWLWKWSGQATDPVEIGEQGQGLHASCFKQLKVTSNKATIKLMSTAHLYFRFTHIINDLKETNAEDTCSV